MGGVWCVLTWCGSVCAHLVVCLCCGFGIFIILVAMGTGDVKTSSGDVVYTLRGSWDRNMTRTRPGGEEGGIGRRVVVVVVGR